MVVVSPSKSKTWIAGMRLPGFRNAAGDRLGPLHLRRHRDDGKSRQLGILSFEAARAMARLVSIYRGLSDEEVARARAAMRSQGVAYLNSTDQGALLRLACAEVVDDLDAAAAAVSRLGRRCRVSVWAHGFEHVYADLKAGVGDVGRLGLGSQPKDVEKKVKKMEKYVASTSALHVAMEGLAELEASEQRLLARWKQQEVDSLDALHKRMAQLRDLVQQLRGDSLWGHDVNDVAELMARSVISIFARACTVYGTFVSDLPRLLQGRHGRVELVPLYDARRHLQHLHTHRAASVYSSGPLERGPVGNGGALIRNSGPILRQPAKEAAPHEARQWKEKALDPPPNTLGATGLALRYAKVIVLVERLATSPEMVAEETREELYWMLPVGLRGAVGAKLRGHRRMDDDGGEPEALAGGWREAVEGILGWLAPMARDTVRWHSERSFEQRQLDPAPRVLVLQTLVFSDKEKAEAAIVELLVAFSCVCRYRQEGQEEEGGDY